MLKILERIILYHHIMEHFNTDSILIDQQFGFTVDLVIPQLISVIDHEDISSYGSLSPS